MDRIIEALKNILPEDQVSEVSNAVKQMLAESEANIKEEADANLQEAYEKLSEEVKVAEEVAAAGYQQAYEIIAHLMNTLEVQKEEFESALEEGFEEAFGELEKNKKQKNNVEAEVYNEFDGKLKEMREFFINKMDNFLGLQEQEMYESAYKHIMSDPQLVEHRAAVEKIAEIVGGYTSDSSYTNASQRKLDEVESSIENLKGQLRLLQTRNVRLSDKNGELHEQVREANTLITEAQKYERRERASKKKNARGRGHSVAPDQGQILSEYVNPETTASNNQQVLVEEHDELNDLLVLSGLQES